MSVSRCTLSIQQERITTMDGELVQGYAVSVQIAKVVGVDNQVQVISRAVTPISIEMFNSGSFQLRSLITSTALDALGAATPSPLSAENLGLRPNAYLADLLIDLAQQARNNLLTNVKMRQGQAGKQSVVTIVYERVGQ